MFTMGRWREKAMAASNPYYVPQLLTHFAIIDAYHDWNDGACTPARCLDRVFRSLGGKPGKAILETAGYWFRRAAPSEPVFVEYIFRLAAHKSALARLYAGTEMPEPINDRTFELAKALISDKSRRVREAMRYHATMDRWLSIVPLLREAEELRADSPTELEQAISLIENGYFERGDGWVVHYCGEGPAGTRGIGGTEAARAKEAIEILSRLNSEELEFRRVHGHWPKRPRRQSGDYLKSLRDWSPARVV